ncbi:dihydrodipicolinate synthase/N-acetylneuraminate lyase [Stemphylium lycopersici]|uniref:Dihydrodipicolinate synthase/N-acetylneuraminate lyase n=1 Tax=Stemphylium lycopersici TaxID=183478 RepID=A0A364NFB7_STELY|nr:dihydrodipicolinate synthase/N-acetylneuraminate lyase [Stemphylium lycopersici]
MAPQELKGILVALVTPFIDDGKAVHEGRLQAHIERMIDTGVHGLVPGGTTGEFTAMTLEERKQATELCVRYAAGRVPVVAGVGALSTRECVDLATHAAKAGAAALMLVPPFYDPVNYEQLREMMKEIYEASGLLIVYYNIPSASGITLSPTELASLSDVGVHYMKDTSGNAPALTELLFELDDKITAFNGWDTLTFYGLAAGAKGSVWGATNIIPELSMELWKKLAVEHDLKAARKLWRTIFPICKFLESHNYPSAIKTGMELRGWETGGLRKPFSLLNEKLTNELAGLLHAAGVQNVRAKWLPNGA